MLKLLSNAFCNQTQNINRSNKISSNFTYFNGKIHSQPQKDIFIKSSNNTVPIQNKNVSFKGVKGIPLEEVAKLNKEYKKVVNNMSKEDLVNDLTQTYVEKLKNVIVKNAPTQKGESSEFYKDFQHELFGSYIQQRQLKLLMLPPEATQKDAAGLYHQIGDHVNGVMNRYTYFVENKLDDPNTPVTLKKVFGMVKDSLEEKVKGKNLKLDIQNEELLEKSGAITHKGYKNYTIMANLLENATKYSPENSEIKAVFKEKDGNIHFIVKDHGIGIPKEDQETVLTTGSRGSNVGNIHGTGHGLYRINQILKYEQLPEPIITSPLYPNEKVYKGTQIDVPILVDKK